MKFIKKLLCKINEDDVFGMTAELTFYTIMTFFPFAILLLALFSSISGSVEEVIKEFMSSFPSQAKEIILYLLNEIDKNTTVITACGFLSAWSISCAVKSICKALNRIYKIKETRRFITVRIIGIIFAVLFLILIVFTFAFLVYGNATVYAISKLFPHFVLFGKVVRLILMYLILTFCFMLIYKFLPNKILKFRDIYIGSLATSGLWFISSIVYSIYTSSYSGNDIVFGGFSGVIFIITWLYLSGFILLLGGELNSLIYEKKHSG